MRIPGYYGSRGLKRYLGRSINFALRTSKGGSNSSKWKLPGYVNVILCFVFIIFMSIQVVQLISINSAEMHAKNEAYMDVKKIVINKYLKANEIKPLQTIWPKINKISCKRGNLDSNHLFFEGYVNVVETNHKKKLYRYKFEMWKPEWDWVLYKLWYFTD